MEEYQVKKIVNLPNEEIDLIQSRLDAENLETINKAYQEGRISGNDCEYLTDFYSDGMGVYREVYRALYEFFRIPERVCAFDTKTGKIDTDSNGNPIHYGLKAVTPFTCTRLEYVDKFNNPIYVICPPMKSAVRAIEKLECECNIDYYKSVRKASDLVFEQEDREAFCDVLQSIKPGNKSLNDILRLTITCKYVSDVERIKRLFTENRGELKLNFYINDEETRDRFLLPLSKNAKRYYDIKMIMHQLTKDKKPLNVEVQAKVQTLYEYADLRTHKIYEQIRSIEAELSRKSYLMDSTGIRQKQAQIQILNNRIRKINETAIHQYNMTVVDKARRIEDEGYRPLRIGADNVDGTYNQCRQLLNKDYLVESYDGFNPDTAFSADNEINKLCFLRLIGKIDKDFDEFGDNAGKVINSKFSRLSLAEKERFKGITEVAQRYAPLIQRKIMTKANSEVILSPSLSPTRQNSGR